MVMSLSRKKSVNKDKTKKTKEPKHLNHTTLRKAESDLPRLLAKQNDVNHVRDIDMSL